jgi:hypothetical protein
LYIVKIELKVKKAENNKKPKLHRSCERFYERKEKRMERERVEEEWQIVLIVYILNIELKVKKAEKQ